MPPKAVSPSVVPTASGARRATRSGDRAMFTCPSLPAAMASCVVGNTRRHGSAGFVSKPTTMGKALFLQGCPDFRRNGLRVAPETAATAKIVDGLAERTSASCSSAGVGSISNRSMTMDAAPAASSRWIAAASASRIGVIRPMEWRLASSIATISTLLGAGRGPRIWKRRSMRVFSKGIERRIMRKVPQTDDHKPGRKTYRPEPGGQ